MDRIEERRWLEGLKVGDLVNHKGGTWDKIGTTEKVARITPKRQIVTESGKRFGPDGWEIGGSSHNRRWLRPVTAEIIEASRRKTLKDRIERAVTQGKIESYTTETLQAVAALLGPVFVPAEIRLFAIVPRGDYEEKFPVWAIDWERKTVTIYPDGIGEKHRLLDFCEVDLTTDPRGAIFSGREEASPGC